MRTLGLSPLREPFRRRNLLKFPLGDPWRTRELEKIETGILLPVSRTKNAVFFHIQGRTQAYVWKKAVAERVVAP